MKLKTILIAVFSLLVATAPVAVQNAYAQQDIGGIIDEIFKGGQFPKQEQEKGGEAQQGRIDNIPVDIRYDTQGRDLPPEAMLIVSAYAPPPANVRRSLPLMLGQTRLLMSGLGSPVQVIIAAPSSITQDLDHARIEAKIIDINGTALFELPFPGKYSGYDAPVLNLIPVGGTVSGTVSGTVDNNPQTTMPGSLTSETVRGSVKLNGRAPKFSGSNLIVRLIEDGLAGGNSSMIAGETRQILDGKRAPFKFELERVIDKTSTETPLALEVWIEDWAGRKTHVTPAPIPYNGPDTKYRIRLDAIGPQIYNPPPKCTRENPCTNMPTLPAPKPVSNPIARPKPKPIVKPITVPPVKRPVVKSPVVKRPVITPPVTTPPVNVPAFRYIDGKAIFNADKGLPKGSILIAVLERQDSQNRNHRSHPATLASTRVSLDGLSGNIEFKLKANTVDLTPALPAPVLRVRIESADGSLFFSNPGGTQLVRGFNTVDLQTSPNY